MANIIKHKRGSGKPSNGVLIEGEIGLDLTNKRLYYGDKNNQTQEVIPSSADTLSTPRTITTNLASTTSVSFDGSESVSIGVNGTLPISNGGTGATTADSARGKLKAAIENTEGFTVYGGVNGSTTNCLLIDTSSAVGSNNYDMQISTADASTLENCPVSSGGFTAYRKVIPIKQTSGGFDYMVILVESQPTEGRIWENLYSGYWKTWSGWKLVNSAHTHTKADIGLGNVDNTADANKIVKQATNDGAGDEITRSYRKRRGELQDEDFNNATVEGTYTFSSTANSTGLKNAWSTGGWGTLEVYNNKFDGQSGVMQTWIVQVAYTTTGLIYTRYRTNLDEWSSWVLRMGYEYGSTLPTAGKVGRVFLKKV